MESLESLMNKELKKLGSQYNEVKEFITNDEESAKFIRNILKDQSFATDNEKDSITNIAQVRARHSAVTFLMGLVFWQFGWFENDNKQSKNIIYNKNSWHIIALYHDIGYFSKLLKRNDIDFNSYFKYNLYTDDYSGELSVLNNFSTDYKDALAYKYEEIFAYDRYAKKFHKENDKDGEYVDHGILGGAITFNKLVSKLKNKNNAEKIILYKYCALTIAQHNFYKSDSEKRDIEYPKTLHDKLSYGSAFRISQETPFLLFLCLVDTIEAVKRFSKSENRNKYLETLTVLRSIDIELNENELILDFTVLKDKCEDETLKKAFEKYFQTISKLDTWTKFHAEVRRNEYILKITYRKLDVSTAA